MTLADDRAHHTLSTPRGPHDVYPPAPFDHQNERPDRGLGDVPDQPGHEDPTQDDPTKVDPTTEGDRSRTEEGTDGGDDGDGADEDADGDAHGGSHDRTDEGVDR